MNVGSAVSAASSAAASSGFSFTSAPEGPSKAEQAFDAYQNMTPAQKLRAQILGSMNLTEDKLKAMSTDDRQKVEEKIRQVMLQKAEEETEKKTGLVVDFKA